MCSSTKSLFLQGGCGLEWRVISYPQQWKGAGNYKYDVAIILLKLNENGQHIQDLTNAFGISLSAPKKSLCSFKGLQIKCNMGGGVSGRPWLQSYKDSTNSGQQVSLTSFLYPLAPSKMNGREGVGVIVACMLNPPAYSHIHLILAIEHLIYFILTWKFCRRFRSSCSCCYIMCHRLHLVVLCRKLA